MFAATEGANVRELCRRFEIARERLQVARALSAEGRAGLAERSRRPQSVGATPAAVEARCGSPGEATTLGGRKISGARAGERSRRRARSLRSAGHGYGSGVGGASGPWRRFEREARTSCGKWTSKAIRPHSGRCHPLTVLDDHSRYNLVWGPAATSRARRATHLERSSAATACRSHADGQRPALGDPADEASQARRVAAAPRRRPAPWAALSPADPGQGRALPSDAQGRSAQGRACAT